MPLDAEPDLEERWRELALGVLRKAGQLGADATTRDAEARLRTVLPGGIPVRALYLDGGDAPDPGFPGQAPYLRGAAAAPALDSGWDVRQLHDDPDVAATRVAIADDLDHGVRSLWLRVGEGAIPPGALEEVLAGVVLEAAPVVLEAIDGGEQVARSFLALAASRGISPQILPGTLGLDPIGQEARLGRPQDLAAASALTAQVAARYPRLRPLVVDGLLYAEAGATDTEELGCAIATGIAYLRALADRGVGAGQAVGQIEFRLAAGTDQFLTIAKLRAARRLWARVTEVTGDVGGAVAPSLHVVTSPALLTRRDPWVNMVRATIAAFAAGVGGADALTVLPFDHAVGHSDAFARRIARNTAALLQDEAELGRVLDPGGGSWYLEQLSDQVAHAAWAWMQEIERAGGQREALHRGLIAERLDRSRAARQDRVRRLHDPITGVSAFPDLRERGVTRKPRAALPPGGLPVSRAAEPFEALRDRADAVLAATGTRPAAFLAALGPPARNRPRVQFVLNLLAAGGIEGEAPEGGDGGVAGVVQAYRAGPRRVAVICGADPDYAEQAAPLARALKEAGAPLVALAGRPGVQETAWRAAGVDRFLWRGGDAVADLEAFLKALEPAGVRR